MARIGELGPAPGNGKCANEADGHEGEDGSEQRDDDQWASRICTNGQVEGQTWFFS
jgi:hypothetical protein